MTKTVHDFTFRNARLSFVQLQSTTTDRNEIQNLVFTNCIINVYESLGSFDTVTNVSFDRCVFSRTSDTQTRCILNTVSETIRLLTISSSVIKASGETEFALIFEAGSISDSLIDALQLQGYTKGLDVMSLLATNVNHKLENVQVNNFQLTQDMLNFTVVGTLGPSDAELAEISQNIIFSNIVLQLT